MSVLPNYCIADLRLYKAIPRCCHSSRGGTKIETKVLFRSVGIAVLALTIAIGTPSVAQAFSLDSFLNGLRPTARAAQTLPTLHSFSTPVLSAAMNLDPNPNKGGGDICVDDEVALCAEVGPEGTMADIESASAKSGEISIYVVRTGDTLSEIAQMFGVTTNTVLWANDLKSSKDIHPGDTLVILPITGVKHVVKKGETIATLAKKYKADAGEILSYNGLPTGTSLSVGSELIIPHGVESPVIVASSARSTTALKGAGGPSIAGYYLCPIAGCTRTQGLHGYNGVDLKANYTQVLAAASGTVVVARLSGYNGGYGSYVVIQHSNGTQTLYAHLSQVYVSVGQVVGQGQVLGISGNSGRSTGPHLHFEIRGAKNPF